MTPETEYLLRKALWLRHGHHGPALYGDDGEMQCNVCMIDFKRDPVDKICGLLLEPKPLTKEQRVVINEFFSRSTNKKIES